MQLLHVVWFVALGAFIAHSGSASPIFGPLTIQEIKALLQNSSNGDIVIEIEETKKLTITRNPEKEEEQECKDKFLGETRNSAAESCQQLAIARPDLDSGYYWVKGASLPTEVYCDMDVDFDEEDGWMRVADVDMSNTSSQCPSGLQLVTSPQRLCKRPFTTAGCSSVTFTTHGVKYGKVCGKVIGVQYYSPDAFNPFYAHQQYTIDDQYVDGVSLTHGSNPRKHIWTFAAAPDEIHAHQYSIYSCPCTSSANQADFRGVIPDFVGDDYYCETGSRNLRTSRYYTEDPLWDGEGCGAESTCCDGEGKPWFCKQLPEATTDDIELRLCVDQNSGEENLLLETVEIYVQ